MMLPITYLDGHPVWQWSRARWLASYLAGAALFALVILPLPDAWGELSAPAATVTVLFGSFGLVSLAVWGWCRFRSQDRTHSTVET